MKYPRDLEALEAHQIDLTAIFRDAVDRSGKSLYAIAEELGVNRSTLTRPYNGERVPPLELVCRVATVAGLRVKVSTTKARGAKP